MSKRKVVAGGYEESSDASDIDGQVNTEQALKRSKSAPYAPPRLTSGSFQLPRSVSSSIRGSVPPRHVSLSRSTPEIKIVQDRDARGSTPAEGLSSTPNGPKGPPKVQSEPLPVLPKLNSPRPTLVLERQINEMTDTFEGYKCTSDQRHRLTDAKLDRILEAVNRLASTNNLVPQALGHPLLPGSTPSEATKQHTSNPSPTPELIDIVSKVVSEARGRVGKKKGGADDNSCKEHARNTFYRMLGISAAREIRPFFEDDYGEPDTLPAQFVDPDTGYCRPYPHWKAPLTKQVLWIPTYMLRFRSTIPNDQSKLSNMLRTLSDEQIVTLLNDGPFKSAQAAWRELRKTDTEIEAMRSNARRYQRCDRKAAVRAAHLESIPSLQGPEWEYLTQTGYMSQDESDVEGGITTKRPEHRAKWETNLFDAINVAECKKARAKPGPYSHLPPRRVNIVKRPVPQLERGTGSGKVTIRIALCGLSKSWREKNPEEFRKYTHLINMKAVVKPDINSFLAENPMLDTDVEEGGENKGSMGADHEGDVGVGADAGGDGAGQYDNWKDEGYEEEESGMVLDILEKGGNLAAFGIPVMTGEQGVPELADGFSVENPDIPIDPQLQDKDVRDDRVETGSKVASQFRAAASSVLSKPHRVTSAESTLVHNGPHFQNILNANHAHNPLPLSRTQEMPPPPPLNHNPSPVVDQPVANTGSLAEGKRQTRASKVQSVATGEAQSAPAPKRRGRPPGSKNKKKAVGVDMEMEAGAGAEVNG